MSIYPTRTAAHVALLGVIVMGSGIVAGEPSVVAWGGAMLVALALARMVTLASVMRVRSAGFEMQWVTATRVARIRCGQELELEAELRNRDTCAARFEQLRVVASPALAVRAEPLAGDVPGAGTLRVRVKLRGLRVGLHGLHGLSLEIRGAPGLFEVPLTFANPYGIVVSPRALGRALSLPHGGRSGTLAMAGRAGSVRGDGTELRELREHQPGDPFRRIAWKASAKRGVLVVREFDREQRDVVVLVLDASVEHWAGPMGGAPLDHAVDVTATLAARHLGEGDLVALRVVAARELASVPAAHGREQAARIATALTEQLGVLDADRCGWDESDLLMQVAEHLRPLDPGVTADLRSGDLDRVVLRASAMRGHAPFQRPAPYGRSARDRRLRRYAACFGLHVPARLQPDQPRMTALLAELLSKVARQGRPRPSLVHVVAPSPPEGSWTPLTAAIRRLRAARVAIRWTTPWIGRLSEGDVEPQDATPYQQAVVEAVAIRALAHQRRAEAWLRRQGVKLVRVGLAPSPGLAPPPPTAGETRGAA